MGKWQRVFSHVLLHRTEIVKAVLEDQGLQPVLINKKDQAYQFGEYEIVVPPDQVIRALKIIEDDIRFE